MEDSVPSTHCLDIARLCIWARQSPFRNTTGASSLLRNATISSLVWLIKKHISSEEEIHAHGEKVQMRVEFLLSTLRPQSLHSPPQKNPLLSIASVSFSC